MSKILKAFDRIALHVDYDNGGMSNYDCQQFEDDCEIVIQALQELNNIKNSESDDALDCLGSIYVFSEDYNDGIYRFEKQYNIIKQYIHKSQQHNKVLSIIKEKMVNLLLLELAENVDEYNERIVPNGKLTDEEFSALKRWQNE